MKQTDCKIQPSSLSEKIAKQEREWLLSGIKQNIFLEIRRNYRAFNATQREVLCCFLCSPLQLPSCVLSSLLILFVFPLFLLEGYNNILFLVAALRTGRHLIKNLFRCICFVKLYMHAPQNIPFPSHLKDLKTIRQNIPSSE